MAYVSTYLNFANETEKAFLFYQSVFGGAFSGDGISRLGDAPPQPGQESLSEEDKNLVMHVELRILGGHRLMGSDVPSSMGFVVTRGNDIHITLHPDTRAETKKLFDSLSAGGKVNVALQDMFWGTYYGSCTDQFGVQWMFSCEEKV